MDREPSIEDHIAFRKLLEQKDPSALEVHAAFTSNRNHAAFSAGVISVVRGGKGPKVATSEASKPPSNNSKAVCRHMLTTGKCRTGSNCKFSHDVSQQDIPVSKSTPSKVAKIPLKSVAPAGIPTPAVVATAPSAAVTKQEVSAGAPTTTESQVGSEEAAVAAKSRFLGLFGVRPKSDVANPAPGADTSIPVSVPPAIPAVAASVAPVSPPRDRNIERGLEDLLLDSPLTRPLAGEPAASTLSQNLGGRFGNVFNQANSGPDRGPAADRSRFEFGQQSQDPARLLPPGFGPPPHGMGPPHGHGPPPPPGVFPGMGMPYPPPPLGMHPGYPGQAGHPGQGHPGQHPGHQGHPPPPPGVFDRFFPPPHLAPPGYPGGGMFPGPSGGPHFPPPPALHGPGGAQVHFGGFMPPPPNMHLQQAQLPPGQYGQTYQMMTAAPPQVPPPVIVPQQSSFRGFSVHDMLGTVPQRPQAHQDPRSEPTAPVSPTPEERGRALLGLLGQNQNATAASSTDESRGASQTAFSAPVASGAENPQQKSRALLSLLKSSKSGPGGGQASSPSTPSAGSPVPPMAEQAAEPPSSPVRAAPMPPGFGQPLPSSEQAPAPPADFSTPVKSKPRSLTASDLEEGISATPGPTATPAKKASFFRNTRFQTGSLQIAVAGEVRKHHVMRPSMNMVVHWQMPQADFHTLMNKESSVDLVIGLVRYGSYTNSPCFVAKPIEHRPKLVRDAEGNAFYQGSVAFHAPKSAGQFVYRLFDQATKESILTTLASSTAFTVDLVDFHVNTNLRHILEALSEKSKLKGISQMPTVLRGIRNTGRNDRSNGSAEGMLNDALTTMLRSAEEAGEVINAWHARKAQEDAAKANGQAVESTLTDEMRGNYKQAIRIQAESYETIVAAMESRVLWSMVAPERRSFLALYQYLYCPHLQRSFHNATLMQTARIAEFGFDFDPRFLDPIAPEATASACARVGASIDALMPSLLPRPDFERLRESAAAKLQLALLTENAVPNGTEVALFGSSHNTFGSDGADMDTTLLFPSNIVVNAEDKPIIVERLGVVLSKIGMTNVSVRSTARIPIVQFRDPLHGLDCDISLQNHLAVANTRLLRAYGGIDSRVRTLVFLIKYWAKRRHLNSPSDGTLSSYGFIICLIHFLQNRPIPLVPNLQTLPPTWSGSRQEIPSEMPTPPGFINDALIGPHHPSVHQQQQLQEQLEYETSRRFPRPALPRTTLTSADGLRCNSYFYTPNPSQPSLLPAYAQQNKETVGELLIEFFRYFCWSFDLRHRVVSIRQPRALSKLDKAEQNGWLQSDNLGIEDPFETHYDVAHVIKGAQMAYLRKELLRASALISRMFYPAVVEDSLPASVQPEDFLALLCAECEPPAFTAVAKEKAAAAEAAAAAAVATTL